MSPVLEPMTYDELGEQYRIEMKNTSLSQPRRDLFRAMANLLISLRQEYDRQMSIDPDSIMAEGAEQRKKKAERTCKDIITLRTKKICNMAILGARGANVAIENLTDEERDYYDGILELSKRHMVEVDRLRGKKVTTGTRIDEPPLRDRVVEPVPAKAEEPVQEPAMDPNDEFGPLDDEPFDEEPFYDLQDMVQEPEPAPEAKPVQDMGPEPVREPENEGNTETDGGMEPILIRILEDLPAFAGPDRDYNLSKEDVVTLPKVLADVLVNTEKATVIRPTP